MAKTAKKVKKKPTLASRVIKALGRNSKGLTTDRLAGRVGAKGPSVSATCSRLVRAGKLKRLDGGAGRGSEAVWAVA